MASTGREWLSEQNNSNNARIAGNNACSNFNNNNVNNDNRFRAVFRPWSSLPSAPPVLPRKERGFHPSFHVKRLYRLSAGSRYACRTPKCFS